MLTEGDNFMTENEVIGQLVKPDESRNMTISFKAPEEPGNYISYFKLMVQGSVFGQKVWCNIIV